MYTPESPDVTLPQDEEVPFIDTTCSRSLMNALILIQFAVSPLYRRIGASAWLTGDGEAHAKAYLGISHQFEPQK